MTPGLRLALALIIALVASSCELFEEEKPYQPPPFAFPTPGPTVAPVPSPSPGGAPTSSPILAVFDEKAFATNYTVHAQTLLQSGHIVSRWFGPDCGTFSPQGEKDEYLEFPNPLTENYITFTWTHPHPPCASTTNHANVTVTVRLRNSVGTVECTYVGTLSGTGPPAPASAGAERQAAALT